MEFPEHKCGLYLTHNEHKDTYEPITQFILNIGLDEDFKSPEDRQRSVDMDELWVLHWYPNNPTSFIRVAAPTLNECLVFANEIE